MQSQQSPKMSVEILLQQVIRELQGLRTELKSAKAANCNPDEALMLLGLNNRCYLKYFIDQNLLTRRKGGKSFVYLRSECVELADKINRKLIPIPTVRQLFKYRD